MSTLRIALPVAPAPWARRLAALPALAACAALAACSSSSTPGAAGASMSVAHLKSMAVRHPPPARPLAKSAPGSLDFVAAIPGDKGAGPVEVRFALRSRPELGKPVELDIDVTPKSPLGRLVTSFHTDNGLAIQSGGAASETDRPEPGVPLARALTIVAQHDGIFYVTATVLVDNGADSVARTFSIPVIAGAGAT